MKTLYVHMGMAKTGTTSIQRFMAANRPVLEKHGVCYPLLLYKYPDYGTDRNALFMRAPIRKADGSRDLEKEEEVFVQGMEQICEKFKQFDTVVVSDETLWSTVFVGRTDYWERVLEYAHRDGYGVKAIVYMRPQAEFFESWWNQRVKGLAATYNTSSFDDFIANEMHSCHGEYLAGLQKVEAAIGLENIILKRFDRAWFKNGILQEDFLDCIGLELTDEYEMAEDKSMLNMRLSGNTCELKRQMNMIPDLTRKDRNYLRNVLQVITPLSLENDPAGGFTQEEADAFQKRFDEENRQIAERYLNDGQPLFTKFYKSKGKWEKDNPYLLDDFIRYTALSDLTLMNRIEEQKKLIQAQKKQLDAQKKQLDTQKKQIASLTRKVNEMYSSMVTLGKLYRWLTHPVSTFKKIIKKLNCKRKKK